MARLNTYIFFDGRCAEAMHFYEQALGGRIEMMSTYADSPMAASLPTGFDAARIIHARLVIDGLTLMASDIGPGMPYEGMKGFSLSLDFPTPEAAKPVFDSLAAGGQVQMPLQATFWAAAFGMLVDRFGTPWMIGCEKVAG